MRTILLLSLLLTGCAANTGAPEKTVREFYQFYLPAMVGDSHDAYPDSPQMQRYVAKETLARLITIQGIYEQEIVEADYFTSTQDYAAEWISALQIGQAHDFSDGKVIDVWLGIQDHKKLHLRDYLRREDGHWKIYRVVDITNKYEQNIFDDKAIASAQAYAATIPNR